jgi:hypothetical protein
MAKAQPNKRARLIETAMTLAYQHGWSHRRGCRRRGQKNEAFSKIEELRIVGRDFQRSMVRFNKNGHLNQSVRVVRVYARFTEAVFAVSKPALEL